MKSDVRMPNDWDKYHFYVTIDKNRIYLERKNKQPKDITVVSWVCLILTLAVFLV